MLEEEEKKSDESLSSEEFTETPFFIREATLFPNSKLLV